MSPATRHLRSQLPVIAALGRTAAGAIGQSLFRAKSKGGLPPLPGPERVETLPPRPDALVRDYLEHVGGEPSSYAGTVPPHLFPQWVFPAASRTMSGLPYPLSRVLNGGCRLEVRRPIKSGEPLRVSARLEKIDDDGRRALIEQRVVTGTVSDPEAIEARLYAVVPLGGGGERKGSRKEPAVVATGAEEVATWPLAPNAGLQFALLTGDFNPVHWVRPYARAFGFRSTILHGFSTMARTFEGLVRTRLEGDPSRLAVLDVKFTRPLVLPRTVGLFIRGDEVFVGQAVGAPAYLTGTFQKR
jgi:acyl dehydratase